MVYKSFEHRVPLDVTQIETSVNHIVRCELCQWSLLNVRNDLFLSGKQSLFWVGINVIENRIKVIAKFQPCKDCEFILMVFLIYWKIGNYSGAQINCCLKVRFESQIKRDATESFQVLVV